MPSTLYHFCTSATGGHTAMQDYNNKQENVRQRWGGSTLYIDTFPTYVSTGELLVAVRLLPSTYYLQNAVPCVHMAFMSQP